MSQIFWRTRLPMALKPLSDLAQSFDPALRHAITAGVSSLATVEVISEEARPGQGKRRMALLISVERDTQDGDSDDRDLTCWMAFSNDEDWCDDFRKHGIPIVESKFDFEGDADNVVGRITVHSPAYPIRSMAMPITLRDQRILTLWGVVLEPDDDSTHCDAWAPIYRQFQQAPDIARQTTDLSVARFAWAPLRRGLRDLSAAGVKLDVDEAAWPALAAVLCPANGTDVTEGFEQLRTGRLLDPESVFTKAPDFPALSQAPFSLWPRPADPPVPAPPPQIERLPAATVFGAPHFVFENVEVVGFRLTLPDEAMPLLQKLAEPLNFHRGAHDAMDDFSWRVATPTVVIELLHYGQMRTRSPSAPLMPHDFMSQHEVLVRLLVGKVDDDGSQARDAALFVPTIFVDNAWSKMVGRESQGFPKELAQFCIREDEQLHPLDMAGRRGERAHSVSQVVQVRSRPGFRDKHSHPLLELRYPTRSDDDERFQRVDLNTVLGSGIPGFSRWRQSDFGGREFRKSFARQAMSSGFNGFRTVQATPVDGRGLPPTWIHGHMQITSMAALFPPGIATLNLSCQGRTEGDTWRALCEVLGEEDINLPAGDWYRLRMNLDLSVSDSLSW